MMARDSRLALDSLTTLDRIGIGLATVTAIVHLVLGVPAVPSPQAISFVLAALGFFGGITLLAVGYRRRLLYLVGIPFTAVQIVLYVLLNWPNVLSPGGVFDKVVQLLLVGILVVRYRRTG
jgi:hypothetical protein